MKPLGCWTRDTNSDRRWWLRVGDLAVEVEQSLYGKDAGKWVATRYPGVSTLFGLRPKRSHATFESRDEAMLAAEESMAELVATVVREASKLGLYGRNRVRRQIRWPSNAKKDRLADRRARRQSREDFEARHGSFRPSGPAPWYPSLRSRAGSGKE